MQEFGLAFGALVNSPVHHVTSLLVRGEGEGGWLNLPVAVNCACPFCAVITEGCRVTLCK
jgi:hypothetical protein